MFYNGESLQSGFLEELQRQGRETALDSKPELTEDGQYLWEAYCLVGENILVELDLYDRRIGIPEDWEFRDCILLLQGMRALEHKLRKASKE